MSEQDNKNNLSAGAKPRMTAQEVRALICVRRNAARDLARANDRMVADEPVTLTLSQVHAIVAGLYNPNHAEEFSNAMVKFREA